MEKANEQREAVSLALGSPAPAPALEFLPDAVEIEERPVPPQAYWIMYVIIGLLTIGIIWASFSEVDRVVTGRGEIITQAQRVLVQPFSTSIIRSINVETGQVVKANTLLAMLDPTFANADVSATKAKIASLNAQIARLEAELKMGSASRLAQQTPDGQLQMDMLRERQSEFASGIAAQDQEIARLQAALRTNAEQRAGNARNLAVLQEMETMKQRLFREDFVSKAELLDIRGKRISAQTQQDTLNSQEKELRHSLAKAQADRQNYASQWKDKATDQLISVKRDRDQLVEQLAKANKLNSLVEMRAPRDGVILEIAQRSVGSVIKEAEPLFTLVPLDQPLEVEVNINPRDIARLRTGDKVRIKLDAFPFQKHGTLGGVVKSISDDTFKKDEGGHTEATYKARIRITSTRLDHVPASFRLIPGMTSTAEIKIGQRSVISYFLYPIIRSFDESLREP